MTTRLFRQCLATLFAIAAVLVLMGRYTDTDQWLADWMYDFAAGNFPWRDNWFASVLMHQWMKPLFIGMGLTPLAVLTIDKAASQRLLGARQRLCLKVVFLSFLAVTLSVSVLKRISMHACPWDVQRYGGSFPQLRIFDTLPPNVPPGRCFPAGHASVALWLPSIAIWWLPRSRATAGMVFAAGFLPGLALGWVQQLRGAHFLTHTLWSAWIAGLLIVCVARAVHPSVQLD